MTTIHNFVDRRWRDAKCELQQLDGQFVNKVESTVRLQDLGLYSLWKPDLVEKPNNRLSKQWHRLLEACTELTIQESRLQVAADSLSADAYPGMLTVDVGKRVSYHFFSLVVHADVLSEHIKEVIRQTLSVYVDDRERVKKLTRKYKKQVEQGVFALNKLRNDLVHARRSFARGITEGRLWEGGVAMGATPQTSLDKFYSHEHKRLRSGVYAGHAELVTTMCASFSSILGELENEIQKE